MPSSDVCLTSVCRLHRA